ncbi:type I methionyl aminopeptidase [Cryobacterium psychrophilum]|uniref:Methionine aminopeptidase n=2 Tax=Cryobacterium psychrophilum TaxID=41988 RepID=A0A4Y8KY15_9MICO|nr:type I methionyl aminopeptidase [Cryobacterium psychrophilum]
MVAPGLATAASLAAARAAAVPGATTLDVDAAAEAAIVALGGKSNFKLEEGYNHTVCASVNDEVVHGIPTGRVLVAGDILSVDSGAIIEGWNGDAAFSIVIPDPDRPDVVAERQKLSDVTEQSLWHGIAVLATGRWLNEVGDAIEDYVESQGPYGILTDYVGHGIGRAMHEDPPVFNYRVSSRGPQIKPGLVVAIEPMVVMGSIETTVRPDDWTIATTDGLAAAHWEHSIAVHQDGIWVLTAEDGGAAGLAQFGIVPVPIP